jgi:D-alanyl-D-alanine carboxypeptidase
MCFAYWRRPQGKRAALAIAVTLIGAFLAMTADADAGPRKRSRAPQNGWQAGFASIVIDAKTGNVLDEENADALRHPASLTKIMTLYMLFEQIENGKFKLDSKLKVSEYAAEQPPSKLGLREDMTIDAESAIKALVTRSANDVAVVIAEALAEDEDDFAVLMTKKARALGMSKTVFKNASGLPHRDQVTTARDMATLGRAVQDRFPKLYRYFSTQHFVWRGRVIANHNRMFGRIPGVDGIKTGYTNASGFNLVTSVRHKNRHVVAVVLGGRTGAQRDNHMRELIVDYLDDASAGPRTAPLVVEAPAPAPVKTAKAKPQPQRIVRVAAAKQQMPIIAGSKDPIRPIMVKTMPLDAEGKMQQTVQANLFALSFSNFSAANAVPVPMTPGPIGENVQVAEANVLQPPAAALSFASTQQQTVAPALTPVPAKPQVLAESPQTPASNAQTPVPNLQLSETEELELEARALAALKNESAPVAAPAAVPASASAPIANNNKRKHQVASASTNSIPVAAPAPTPEPQTDALPAAAKIGWSIQIGAYPDAKQAKERLEEAQDAAKALLAKASPYTEKVSKGSTNLFRARFAGFQNEYLARRACQTLQRNQFDCIVAKN